MELYPYDYEAQHQLASIYRQQEKFEKVEQLERASLAGKNLRREILQSPSTTDISPELMENMANFIRLSGQESVADQLKKYLPGADSAPSS